MNAAVTATTRKARFVFACAELSHVVGVNMKRTIELLSSITFFVLCSLAGFAAVPFSGATTGSASDRPTAPTGWSRWRAAYLFELPDGADAAKLPTLAPLSAAKDATSIRARLAALTGAPAEQIVLRGTSFMTSIAQSPESHPGLQAGTKVRVCPHGHLASKERTLLAEAVIPPDGATLFVVHPEPGRAIVVAYRIQVVEDSTLEPGALARVQAELHDEDVRLGGPAVPGGYFMSIGDCE